MSAPAFVGAGGGGGGEGSTGGGVNAGSTRGAEDGLGDGRGDGGVYELIRQTWLHGMQLSPQGHPFLQFFASARAAASTNAISATFPISRNPMRPGYRGSR